MEGGKVRTEEKRRISVRPEGETRFDIMYYNSGRVTLLELKPEWASAARQSDRRQKLIHSLHTPNQPSNCSFGTANRSSRFQKDRLREKFELFKTIANPNVRSH